MSAVVVLTTASSLREARRIASILLNEKLAACISISAPTESHYVWQGKKEKSREYLLMIKTRRTLFPQAEQAIRQAHSYECPEILALPVSAGSKPYLEWLYNSVKR
ncbi:MAG: divalent-cation tolerance protein CutA [Candidatus Omnitrophica bacterium]|nr:divalent-cation tolerance protein CutA [Candidatus Omnitrophota bacterium]